MRRVKLLIYAGMEVEEYLYYDFGGLSNWKKLVQKALQEGDHLLHSSSGIDEGNCDGMVDGRLLGSNDGTLEGSNDGSLLGKEEGKLDGIDDGLLLGSIDGIFDGTSYG